MDDSAEKEESGVFAERIELPDGRYLIYYTFRDHLPPCVLQDEPARENRDK